MEWEFVARLQLRSCWCRRGFCRLRIRTKRRALQVQGTRSRTHLQSVQTTLLEHATEQSFRMSRCLNPHFTSHRSLLSRSTLHFSFVTAHRLRLQHCWNRVILACLRIGRRPMLLQDPRDGSPLHRLCRWLLQPAGR